MKQKQEKKNNSSLATDAVLIDRETRREKRMPKNMDVM